VFETDAASLLPNSKTTHHVIPEADGVRVLTPSGCEMLQRVPGVTEDIRKVFGTDPAAMLYDAMERFEDGDVTVESSQLPRDP